MNKKACKECGKVKPLDDFPIHPERTDGHTSKCKACMKVWQKEYDKKRANLPHRVAAREAYAQTKKGKAAHLRANDSYRKRNPGKTKARRKVQYELSKGRLKKQPCEQCGSLKAEAHHDDYSKPLDIRWLCSKCHSELHKKPLR